MSHSQFGSRTTSKRSLSDKIENSCGSSHSVYRCAMPSRTVYNATHGHDVTTILKLSMHSQGRMQSGHTKSVRIILRLVVSVMPCTVSVMPCRLMPCTAQDINASKETMCLGFPAAGHRPARLRTDRACRLARLRARGGASRSLHSQPSLEPSLHLFSQHLRRASAPVRWRQQLVGKCVVSPKAGRRR